jgi:hypothetical protein
LNFSNARPYQSLSNAISTDCSSTATTDAQKHAKICTLFESPAYHSKLNEHQYHFQENTELLPNFDNSSEHKDFRIALHSEENQTQSLLTDFPKKPHHASNLVKIGDGLMARKQNFNGSKPSIAIVSYKTTKNRISESFASVQRKTAKVIRKQQLKQIRIKLYSDDDEES